MSTGFFRFIIIFLISYFSYSKISFSNIQNNNAPTKIKAEIIKVIRNSGEIEFINNAIIENADTSILADKIIVFYNEKGDNNSSNNKTSIKEAKAMGNIKIFNDEFVATGDNGFYKPEDESFVITDNVIFNDGTSIAKGERFVYNLAKRKGLLLGAKDEVENVKNNRVIVIINEIK